MKNINNFVNLPAASNVSGFEQLWSSVKYVGTTSGCHKSSVPEKNKKKLKFIF